MTTHRFVTLIVAVALVASACKREPKTIEELRSAGQKAFVDKDYTKAREYFQKGLTKAPSDKGLLYFTGLCFQRETSYDSALVYLRKADILYPKDRDINMALRPVAALTGNWSYAISATGVLVATGDDIRQYYRDLAKYTARNHEPIITVYYQRKVLEQNPDSLAEWVRLGSVLLELDSLDAARRLIDSATAKFGQNDELYSVQGLYLAHEKKYAEAEKVFRALYDKNPGLTNNKVNLANVLSEFPDRAHKQEALDLLNAVPESDARDFNLDSLKIFLKKEIEQADH